jgi:hypothetical protein
MKSTCLTDYFLMSFIYHHLGVWVVSLPHFSCRHYAPPADVSDFPELFTEPIVFGGAGVSGLFVKEKQKQ